MVFYIVYEEMSNSKYIREMQVTRGLGILLVTLGHSEPIEKVFPAVFSFIYSFHMPLFFFLSGFFATKLFHINSLKDYINKISRSTFRFIVPYLVISISYGIIKYYIPHMVKRPFLWEDFFYVIIVNPLRNPALFLWFLYLLIIMRIITPIIPRINRWLLFGVLIIFQFYPIDYSLFAIGWFLNYVIYYFLGMQAAFFKDDFFLIMRKKVFMFLMLCVFLISYIFLINLKYPILRFITASSGSLFVVSLSFCYYKYLPKNILEKLGYYSLQIYLLQFFFIFPLEYLLRKISVPGELIILGTFCVGLVCPLFISMYIFPKSKILSLFYGGINKFENNYLKAAR